MISLFTHHIVFSLLQNHSFNSEKEKIVPLKITTFKERRPQKAKKNKTSKEMRKTNLSIKRNKSQLVKKSEKELIALGKKALKENGSLPSLTIYYKDPKKYLKEMYKRGAKTLLYDQITERLVAEVDLLSSTIVASEIDIKNYSPIKRIINDTWVDRVKERIVKNHYLGEPDDYQIWLIIPLDLELKWFGYMSELFKSHFLQPNEVLSVTGQYEGELKIIGINLKNGNRITIKD
jgi:hypothetical protein